VLPRVLPLYHDELLYSWVARQGNHLNYRFRQDVVRSIFGHEDARPLVDFPSRLGFVSRVAPQLGSGTNVLATTSLFPLYAPFLRVESRESIAACLIGDIAMARRGAHALSMLRLEIPRSLRYCSKCWEEDAQAHRGPYWRRSHQCPGVVICHAHGEVLFWSQVKWARKESVARFITAGDIAVFGRRILVRTNDQEVLTRIAKSAYWLLNENSAMPGPFTLARAYSTALAERGFIRPSGRVVEEPNIWMRQMIGEKLLCSLGCKLPFGDHSWLLALLRTSRVARGGQPPLRHLLVIAALGLEAKEFFAEMKQPPLHMQLIRQGHINPSRPKPSRLRADRRLVQIWWNDPKMSVCEMARRLKVAPGTVTLFAAHEGLSFPRKGIMGATLVKPPPLVDRKKERLMVCRKAFLNYKARYPLLSQTEMVRRGYRKVRWLQKNDSEWLKKNRPVANKKGGAPGLDWEARDKSFVVRLPAILSQFQKAGRRGSFSAVGRELGVNLVNVHRRLPRTSSWLLFWKSHCCSQRCWGVGN
jgi:hypothetical protein